MQSIFRAFSEHFQGSYGYWIANLYEIEVELLFEVVNESARAALPSLDQLIGNALEAVDVAVQRCRLQQQRAEYLAVVQPLLALPINNQQKILFDNKDSF